ncbi:MAG: Putative Sensor histidine kinase with MCP region [Nitrospira sp.]|nr:MAG: Putative Sensor histidine kinase with MCP region [Nitrospira sp.]
MQTVAFNTSSRWTERILPLLLGLCFFIATALGLYALSFLRAMLVAERGNELAMNAAAVADTVDRVLFERYGDIQLFANDGVIREGTSEERMARLLHYSQLYWYYSWLGITDADGTVLAATDSRPAPGAPPINRAAFDAVQRSGTIHLEPVPRSAESQQHKAVGFMAPMYGPRGEFRGVVASLVPIENLRSIFEQEGRLRYGQDTYDWLLLTRDGAIISEKQAAADSANGTAVLEIPSHTRAASDRQQSGFVEEIHHRRGYSVVTGYASTRGYRDFPGFDWIVLFRQTHDQVYAPVDRLLWTVGGIGVLVILPLTGFGILVSWKLGRERSELIKTRQDLETSVAELGRSNADLQQFAYVASHDLQEPLRMVSSYTQLLARRYRGKLDADADEFIAYAVDGATRMQKLIQDLLAYSRVSTGSQPFESTPMGAVLSYAMDNLLSAIKDSQAVVTHDRLPTVRGDAKQLAQVFQNLLSNAIKFHGEGPPRIHISARRKEDEWLFSVRDEGIGIDPQFAGRIFVIFQRLHTRAEYPGTGIGLAICKKIVERHGGRMWVESESGKGATFWFSIPDPSQKPSLPPSEGDTTGAE